jgi:hypothetical protein
MEFVLNSSGAMGQDRCVLLVPVNLKSRLIIILSHRSRVWRAGYCVSVNYKWMDGQGQNVDKVRGGRGYLAVILEGTNNVQTATGDSEHSEHDAERQNCLNGLC